MKNAHHRRRHQRRISRPGENTLGWENRCPPLSENQIDTRKAGCRWSAIVHSSRQTAKMLGQTVEIARPAQYSPPRLGQIFTPSEYRITHRRPPVTGGIHWSHRRDPTLAIPITAIAPNSPEGIMLRGMVVVNSHKNRHAKRAPLRAPPPVRAARRQAQSRCSISCSTPAIAQCSCNLSSAPPSP